MIYIRVSTYILTIKVDLTHKKLKVKASKIKFVSLFCFNIFRKKN